MTTNTDLARLRRQLTGTSTPKDIALREVAQKAKLKADRKAYPDVVKSDFDCIIREAARLDLDGLQLIADELQARQGSK